MAFSEQAVTIKGRNNNSPLAVSRSSSKISKQSSTMLRPLMPQHHYQQQPQPQQFSKNSHHQAAPPPKIYSTDPTSFRNLVQELTGTAASSAPPPTTSRHVNSRLQKIAPPPLKSVFASCSQQKHSSDLALLADPSRSPLAELLSPVPNPSSPLTLHFFPSTSSTPAAGDGLTWPSSVPLDSPYTAAIRQLAQRIVESENHPPGNEVFLESPNALPCSPSFQTGYLPLFSPGISPVFGSATSAIDMNDPLSSTT